jgi:hypothetical protein
MRLFQNDFMIHIPNVVVPINTCQGLSFGKGVVNELFAYN